MSLGKALQLSEVLRTNEVKRVSALKEMFIEGLKEIRPDLKVNGGEFARPHLASDLVSRRDLDESLSTSCPHIINISIPGIDNEFFVLQLDAKGVAISTKSSCLRDEEESYVLKAIGAGSKHSIRVSFGRMTTKREVKKALRIMGEILRKNRYSSL
jgi:cysteine sulfinate desulfinase/cysteine desulfurase-like protein